MGDPDRGFGADQPGGWTFGVLRFLELQTLRDIGAAKTFEQKKASRVTLASQPVGMFKRPTRARPALCDYRGNNIGGTEKINMTETADITTAMRGDYAINVGSQRTDQLFRGPPTLEDGDTGTYAWLSTADHDGISYQRSLVSAAQITDGRDFSKNSNLYHRIRERQLTCDRRRSAARPERPYDRHHFW